MEIEKIIEKVLVGHNTTYLEDQILAVYEITNRVLKDGRFSPKAPPYNKAQYQANKELLFLAAKDVNEGIPHELISNIQKTDAIAVKEYKNQYHGYIYPGIFIIFIGLGAYFLMNSLIWLICCIIIGIYFGLYSFEQLKKANDLIAKKNESA
ncbi:hypothetical protein [Flavobacterium sp. Root901]|uniref:hypothetical protein n=1 Tax=Flavobacterium sp. Root901 TaxID=1736605 RepID=UPI000A62B783|nr:hypothetical protein [Flavobacterium sp. Root901]